jgi:LuxR family maltose regulon positive regulatory protein
VGANTRVVESRIRDIENVFENYFLTDSRLETEIMYDNPEDELRNLKAHIMALKAFQGIYREDYSRAFEMAEKSKSYQPDERYVLSSVEFALGWAYRLTGDLEAAYNAFAKSSAISKESWNIYMAVTTLCRAAYGQVLEGRLFQAERSFLEGERMAAREDGGQYPVAGYAYVYLGGIQYEWNNLDAATEYCLQGIELSQRVGLILDQVVGYTNLAKVKIAEGDLSSAQEACQSAWELSQLMKDYIYTRRWVEDCQVRLWSAQGDHASITRWLKTSDLKLDDPPDFKRDIDQIILARALVALGKMDPVSEYINDALTLLSNLQELAETAEWNGKLIEILVLQAMALQTVKSEDQAVFALESALSLAEPEGYVRTFVDEGKDMMRLLQIVNKRSISRPYVQKLLAASGVDKTMDKVSIQAITF